MNKLSRIWFLLMTLLIKIPALAQTMGDSVFIFSYFKNNGEDGLHLAYSRDGFTWESLFSDHSVLTPAAGKDKLMRDPCIIQGGDGLFHMVWTVSWNERGIGYASSPDLIHWSAQRYLPVMDYEPSTRNAWAPEITYDPEGKEYMIYWASTIPGRFEQKDTAAESRYNHRIYYTLTKDFSTFSDTKLLYDPGFSVIDASIVKNGNRYVMFLKNETRQPVEKNIRVAFADGLTGPYSSPGAPITGKYWAEGPTALKIGNAWVVYFDKYTEHKYGAVTSTDLRQWTDVSPKTHFPEGLRHGTAFAISKAAFEKLLTALPDKK